MAERNYYYEKYEEDGKVTSCPIDDKDGKITGKIVLNVIAYFDENPAIRKALGWVKHITHDPEKEMEYDKQSQFVVAGVKQVDEWTVEDEYHVLDKSEELMAFEELLAVANGGGVVWF